MLSWPLKPRRADTTSARVLSPWNHLHGVQWEVCCVPTTPTHTEPTRLYNNTPGSDPRPFELESFVWYSVIKKRTLTCSFHKKVNRKKVCNKKARLFQIQRKDDLCWTHDTMLLMREREDNKSSQHWTDTRKAISLAFTDICKLLTQT